MTKSDKLVIDYRVEKGYLSDSYIFFKSDDKLNLYSSNIMFEALMLLKSDLNLKGFENISLNYVPSSIYSSRMLNSAEKTLLNFLKEDTSDTV